MGVIFTFIIGLLMAFEPITDNDYFWHVVIGKWIDLNKKIPHDALYSWWGLKEKYYWTSHEWLTEWIMYKAGDVGCIVIMLMIFLGLYYLMYKMLKIDFKRLLDVKLLYLLMMTVFFKVTGPRPYITSLLFFAYLIYVLFSYLDGEKKIFNKLIWTLPILQLIWANIHGGSSSLIYIFLLGVLLSDLFLKIFKIKEERWAAFRLNKKQSKTLWINLLLVIIATCINPVGINLLIYPFTNMADTKMIDYILEWQSPDFHGLLGIYIFIMLAIPVFNMMLTKKNYKFYEIAIFALFFYMALKSQRFIGMFGIYSTWMIGKYLFIDDSVYETLKKPFKKFEGTITYIFLSLLLIITVFVANIQIKNFKAIVAKNEKEGYTSKVVDNDGYYSDGAIEKLISLKPQRMYNDFGNGGYLLYRLNQYNALNDMNIFIYGLGDVFSNNILPDSKVIYNVQKDIEKLLSKYDFDVMLTVSRSPLCQYLKQSDKWQIEYKDEMNYIFTKTK